MNRYRVEPLPNGLTFVYDYRSGLRGCYYTVDGTYAHGDLHAATLDELLGTDVRLENTLPILNVAALLAELDT